MEMPLEMSQVDARAEMEAEQSGDEGEEEVTSLYELFPSITTQLEAAWVQFMYGGGV